MKKHIISIMAVMSLLLSLAAVSTAAAGHMPTGTQRVEGVLKSQSVLEGNDGQEYILYSIPRETQLYIGQKVSIQGFLTEEGTPTDQVHEIRVDDIEVVN